MTIPSSKPCPNCGSERSGRFCANCGQKDQPLRQSTVVFLRQALNEYFGIDGRLWRTLRFLIFSPGKLTSEHVAGRRARYLPPLRIYLSATLLFFFLLSVLDPAAEFERQFSGGGSDSTMTVAARLGGIQAELADRETRRIEAEKATEDARQRVDSAQVATGADSLAGLRPGEPVDSAAADAFRGFVDGAGSTTITTGGELAELLSGGDRAKARLEWQRGILNTYPPDSTIRPVDLEDAAALLFPSDSDFQYTDILGGQRSSALQRLADARTSSERGAAFAGLLQSAIDKLPIVLFLMLPVFALILKVVYVRRGWYYSEHLIFALHNHAVVFLGFSVVAIAVAMDGSAAWVAVLNVATVILLNLYCFVAQRRVYGQGWIKTTLKFAVVFAAYWTMVTMLGALALIVLAALVG